MIATRDTDRYVSASVGHLPETLRPKVEQALRFAIADDIEARVASGLTLPDAERAVMRDLSEPADNARRTSMLISPHIYRVWRFVTRLTCATVLPIVYIVLFIVYAVNQGNIWITIFRPVGITMTVAMYVLVAVTGVCALVDRYGFGESDHQPQPSR